MPTLFLTYSHKVDWFGAAGMWSRVYFFFQSQKMKDGRRSTDKNFVLAIKMIMNKLQENK